MRITAKELAKAKALCTATELRLIESSHGPTLEKADAARLKKKITLARELRDKWRDQFTRQRREVQQELGARVTENNQRSEEKIELFANALARFEEQLTKATTAMSGKKTSPRPTPLMAQRVQGHRAARARTREDLKELQVAKVIKKKPATTIAVTSPTPAPALKPPVPAKSKLLVKKIAKKSPLTKKLPLKSKRSPSPLPSSVDAKSAAKSTRLKISGKDSRVRGHVSAAGKRSQARRDSKR